jgi:alpha-mannosidase
VHFGFGFNVPEGEVRMDVPWGVVRPEADQIPGACKNWFTVHRWADVSNSRYGVTWLTPDAPLVQVGGVTANVIGSQSNLGAWIEHLEPSQTLYSWAMNNHWHTNYRAEQEGPTVFRFFLWPHDGPFDAARADRVALECSQPLLVAPARGQLPEQPRLSVSGAGVAVTAFKPSDDGQAWIVRLFGHAGKPEQIKLVWSEPQPKKVWLSDNSEQPLRPVGESVEVPAYGIVTLRAELP